MDPNRAAKHLKASSTVRAVDAPSRALFRQVLLPSFVNRLFGRHVQRLRARHVRGRAVHVQARVLGGRPAGPSAQGEGAAGAGCATLIRVHACATGVVLERDALKSEVSAWTVSEAVLDMERAWVGFASASQGGTVPFAR